MFWPLKWFLLFIAVIPISANTKHLYNICITSARRLWRWSNIVQVLYKCFAFTGIHLKKTHWRKKERCGSQHRHLDGKSRWWELGRQGTLNKCWLNAGPASQTMGQQYTNIVSLVRIPTPFSQEEIPWKPHNDHGPLIHNATRGSSKCKHQQENSRR